MKTLNYVKLLLFCILTINLASCGDDYYTDDYLRNSDEKLCSKTWIEEFTTENNEHCKHQLIFARDNSGQEKLLFYRNNEGNPYKENTFHFIWRWFDADMENIEINYGGGDITSFDNVWVREHNLSGKLEGEVVMFIDAAYYK